eukprot:1888530-Prymnesium_polylepis.1
MLSRVRRDRGTVLRCRIDAASLSARRSALHDAHISGAGTAAPTEELEMVVERWSSEMDEAAAIASRSPSSTRTRRSDLRK